MTAPRCACCARYAPALLPVEEGGTWQGGAPCLAGDAALAAEQALAEARAMARRWKERALAAGWRPPAKAGAAAPAPAPAPAAAPPAKPADPPATINTPQAQAIGLLREAAPAPVMTGALLDKGTGGAIAYAALWWISLVRCGQFPVYVPGDYYQGAAELVALDAKQHDGWEQRAAVAWLLCCAAGDRTMESVARARNEQVRALAVGALKAHLDGVLGGCSYSGALAKAHLVKAAERIAADWPRALGKIPVVSNG